MCQSSLYDISAVFFTAPTPIYTSPMVIIIILTMIIFLEENCCFYGVKDRNEKESEICRLSGNGVTLYSLFQFSGECERRKIRRSIFARMKIVKGIKCQHSFVLNQE